MKKTARSRAKQQRALDTRRQLLSAALREFADNGYGGASTRNIARQAGVLHGLVAYHFGGKEGLWRALITDLLEDYREHFRARLRELEAEDAATRLRAVQEDMFVFDSRRMDFHRIIADLARTRSPQLKWVVKEYIREVYDVRAALIGEVQKEGRYVEGDPYHLQYLLLGAYLMPLLLGPEMQEITGKRINTPQFRAAHKQLCLSLFFRE